MKRCLLKNQRGVTLLFTTTMLVILFVFGGIAIDMAYFGTVRREMQRSMEAAALAGAGNLGFNDSVFPAARAAAQNFASLNGYSDPAAGVVSLASNDANAPDGHIVLGIWDGENFAPSVDGSIVNAVQCQYATPIPTSFLRLLGLNSLAAAASAIAVSNPPLIAPPGQCVFPIALSSCPFLNAGAYSSQGCGAAATFHTSSGKSPEENAGTNTAAWANVCGTGTPNAGDTKDAVNAAAGNEACAGCASGTPEAGNSIGTNNGVLQPAFDAVETNFIQKFNQNVTQTVTDANGNVTYSGRGWKVFVPVIETECPPQAINGAHKILGWSEMVVTQVINKGYCAVNNSADQNSWSVCPPPNAPQHPAGNPSGPPVEPDRRAIFGYYNCTLVDSVASREPGPRSALGTKLRLVR